MIAPCPATFDKSRGTNATDEDCRQIVRLAVREDLEREQDWTTLALVHEDRTAPPTSSLAQPASSPACQALAVADRRNGRCNCKLDSPSRTASRSPPELRIARLAGSVRDLLTSERMLLNLLGRLMGIATLAHAICRTASHGTQARIYDTRKTTPGWRRLEKYAVQLRRRPQPSHRPVRRDPDQGQPPRPIRGAGPDARRSRRRRGPPARGSFSPNCAADRLRPADLDHRSRSRFARATCRRPARTARHRAARQHDARPTPRGRRPPQLHGARRRTRSLRRRHARHGARIAETGVDRISVGGLTHSARSLDVGLDWPL